MNMKPVTPQRRLATVLFVVLSGIVFYLPAANAQNLPPVVGASSPPALLPFPSAVSDVLSPTPPPSGEQSIGSNEWAPVDKVQVEGTGSTPTPPEQPFRWGALNLRPHLLYRFLYVDGILARTNLPVTTVIHEIAPGFLLEFGKHWTLDYTPTWRVYTDKHFANTLDHNVNLAGRTEYKDWVFGLSQGFLDSSAPLIETGTQTELQTYTTALSGLFRMNSKMSLDLGINQTFRTAQGFDGSREWSTLDWLNYQLWPRLDVAIGVRFGYVDLDTGSDMTYEQLQGRINWRATDKLHFQVHGGVEDRQFLSGGAGDLINPVFGLALQYIPFEVTKFSLSADRSITPSYFQDLVVESTGVGAGLSQRLLKKVYLDLGAGYRTVKYVASANVTPPVANRSDDYYSLNARLSYVFLKRGTIAVLYQYTDNSSSQDGFSYLSRQVGVELRYRY